ncbi:MAG: type II secretion system F family protein [Rhodospirillales bacterium]|jgi:tight adherence protein C|nr:type II secretion system F family protein [Rhodospirillales bacterium]
MSAFELLPAWLSPESAVSLGAGLAAMAAVVALWQTLVARHPMDRRVKALRRHRDALKAGLVAPGGNRSRPRAALGVMGRVVNGLDLVRGRQARGMSARLAEAGWRSKDALVVYLFFKLSLPLASGGLAAIPLYALDIWDLPPLAALAIALASVLAGAYAPELFVGNVIAKRRKAIQKGLPDALDLLVICAEAGLTLDAALERVTAEMRRSAPELADEFGLCAVELGFLPERAQALANLAARVDMASIRGMVNTLAQTEKYGTPLARSLRVLASEYRDERMLKAEEKAAKLPATLTLPLVLFILPSLFIVLLGPAILSAIDGLGGL